MKVPISQVTKVPCGNVDVATFKDGFEGMQAISRVGPVLKGLVLGLMISCCHLEIINNF